MATLALAAAAGAALSLAWAGRGEPWAAAGVLAVVAALLLVRGWAGPAASLGAERFRHAFSASLSGAALLGLDGVIQEVNATLARQLGLSAATLRGRDIGEFVSADDLPGLLRSLNRLARPGNHETARVEATLLAGAGDPFLAELDFTLVRGTGEPFLHCQVRDVTADRSARDLLAHQANTDPLTGLPNRALLIARLQTALIANRQRGVAVGVLLIDLDRFKLINDSCGHGAGDKLLLTIADRLRHVVRDHDTVARLGGDEFVVMCEGHDAPAAIARIAVDVVDAIGQPVAIHDFEVTVGASVGIAVAAGHSRAEGRAGYQIAPREPEDLLREADLAMYTAKSSGGNRAELFDHMLRDRVTQRLRTEIALRRALRQQQLSVHYQPIVDLRTGAWTHLEALVRWPDPAQGLLKPSAFMAIAEETELVAEVGRFVVARACRDMAVLRRETPAARGLRLAVNVSMRQLGRTGFATELMGVAEDNGLSGEDLAIEVTETLLMAETTGPATAGVALSELHRAREHSAQVLLDDFGTGFSSLSRLRALPVDTVKVDRSFISGNGDRLRDPAIVQAIIDLAATLRLAVVAEGVETEQQRLALAQLGCAQAQGYLFGRPMAIEEVRACIDSARARVAVPAGG